MSSKNNDYEIPTMVRILPMDRKVEFSEYGDNIKRVQDQFFIKELPSRPDNLWQGKYRYRAEGMNAEPGTVVLFQYYGKVIASAVLNNIDKSPQVEEGYYGAYFFDPSSIQIFEPVSSDEIKLIWGDDFIDSQGNKHKGFKRFGQAKIYLDPKKYSTFCSMLKSIRSAKIGS